MAKEYISDIELKGKLIIYNVPNNTGTLTTYNVSTKTLSTRSNEDIISDMYLMTTNTDQNVFAKKWFSTVGGNTSGNHNLFVKSYDGSSPGIAFEQVGGGTAQIRFNGTNSFEFVNNTDTDFKYVTSKGFIKPGGVNSKVLLDGGGDKPIGDFALNSQLTGYVTLDTPQDIYGKKTFRANFLNYTPDGLFDEVNVAHSLKLLTAGEKKIIFGYRDYGSGQYFARIGFTSNTNWSLGAVNDYFTIGTNNDGTETFKLTSDDGFINGNKIWNAGNFNPTLYVTQSNLNTQLLGYATLAGVQTFTGTNTFNQNIIIPNPTLNSHAVNLQSLNINDRNFITDSRGASRPPSYYDDRYAQWDFQNVADTSAGGDYWHGVLTVAKWDSFNPEHRQEQLLFTGDELKRRTALDDGTWGSVKTIHDTGNLPLNSIVRAINNGVDANLVSDTSFNHGDANMPSWFPIDSSGTLLHKQYDGNFATQFAMSYYGGIGYRNKAYGSFGAWQKIVTSSELNDYVTLNTVQPITNLKVFTNYPVKADEGYQNSGVRVNQRNRIWSFGNADDYGISYFQGTYNSLGDGIVFHFGDSTDYKFYIKSDGQVNSKIHGNSSQWYQAHQWGDHNTMGYLTSSSLYGYATTSWVSSNFMSVTHPANQITQSDIDAWNDDDPVNDWVHDSGTATFDLTSNHVFFHNITIQSTGDLNLINFQVATTITFRIAETSGCNITIDGGSQYSIDGNSTTVFYKNRHDEIIISTTKASTSYY